MSEFSRTVFKNSSWGLAAQLAIKVLSFAFSVIVIRRLGADDFGQYSAVLAFVGAFAVLSDLGLGVYGVRQIARWRAGQDGIRSAEMLYADVMVLRLILSFATSILLFALSWLTRRPWVMIGAIGINSLSLFLYAIQGSNDMVLSGYERLDISARSKIVNQLVFVIFGGLVLFLGWGYYGLILANLIAVSLMAAMTWRGVRKIGLQLGAINWPRWASVLKASLPFGIIGLALGLSYKFDTILLNVFRSDTETGYYGAAYNLVFTAFVISGTVNSSIFPSLTREYGRNPDRISGIMQTTLRYLMIISLPIAFGAWALAKSLITFLYSADFQPAVPALAVVIWAVPLMYASDFLGYIVLITNQERRAARAVCISTAANIMLNLILVPRFGVVAAAAMTVLTELILVGQYTYYLRDQLRQLRWIEFLGKPLLASILMAGVVVGIRDRIAFLPAVLTGVIVYGLLLAWFRAIGKQEFQFLRSLLGRGSLANPIQVEDGNS